MNLIYLNLVILIFTQNAFSLENYFNNSIIRILRDNKLEFTSDLSFVLTTKKFNFTDNYSFKLKSGTLKILETSKNGQFIDDKVIYLNNVNEFNYIDLKLKKCFSRKGYDKFIYSYLRIWIPDRNIIVNRNQHILLGPNSLVVYLLDAFDTNKEAIKCEDLIDPNRNNPKKCTIQKEYSEGGSFKIEYYFENRDEYTMYPFLIKSFNRRSSISKWYLLQELKYLNFKPNFNMKKPTVDLSLPKGIKCKRV